MPLVAVADSSAEFPATVAALLAGHPTIEIRVAQRIGAELLADPQPDVVVIGPSIPAEEGLAFAAMLSEGGRSTKVVLMTGSLTTELMRSALRAGVSDVVSPDDPASERTRAILGAVEEAARLPLAAGPSAEPAAAHAGTVVCVFSTKGGVGKTVLATNLGVALAGLGKKTVLVDLDLQFGDVGIMLGLTPERTIADAVQSIERLDSELLTACLTPHESGLMTLLAPVQPEEAENVTAGRITRILSLLSESFEYVVIDTAATFDEVVLTAIDKSSSVYAVTMMDVASIKNTRISLQKLRQLGYADSLVHIVLNRADSKVWLQPSEVEKAIGAKILAKIPSDRTVPRSVNKGRPVVLDAPRAEVSRAMVGLAKDVLNIGEREAKHVS